MIIAGVEILTQKQLTLVEQYVSDFGEDEMRQYAISKGYYDRSFFVDYCLEEYGVLIEGEKLPVADHMREIWSLLDSGQDINVIIARGHAKTTTILIWILRCLCYSVHRRVLYIAHTTLGEEGVGKIRGELETNQTLRLLFGSLVPDKKTQKNDEEVMQRKWRQKILQLTNGTTLFTLSKGQSVRGNRPNVIIFDDPQENKDVKNKRIVDQFNTRVFTSLYNTLLPGGYMATIGTVVGNLCLVYHLRKNQGRDTIYREACDENFENILWPEMRSKKSLIERRDAIGSLFFNQEYRNIPLSREDALVKLEDIVRYTTKAPKYERRVLSVDPAISEKEKADYTGLVLGGYHNGTRDVLRSKKIKLSPLKLEDYILALCEKSEPDYVLKEDNVEVGISQRLRKKGIKVESIKAVKDKWTRLLKAVPMIEAGNVRFRESGDEELIHQLTTYPDVEHDDIMDALTQMINHGASLKKRMVYINK